MLKVLGNSGTYADAFVEGCGVALSGMRQAKILLILLRRETFNGYVGESISIITVHSTCSIYIGYMQQAYLQHCCCNWYHYAVSTLLLMLLLPLPVPL